MFKRPWALTQDTMVIVIHKHEHAHMQLELSRAHTVREVDLMSAQQCGQRTRVNVVAAVSH